MKMMSSTFKQISLLSLLIFTLSACNKDKDVDDYKTEKLHADLAVLKTVEGSYTGYLASKQDPNINLGALKITLTATTQTNDSPMNDGGKASVQPILVAEVEFQGAYRVSIVGQNSFYDSSSEFHTDIPIEVTSGTATGKPTIERVTINGTISGSVMSGSMYASGYSSYGGTFNLVLNGPSLQKLSLAKKPDVTSNRTPILKTYLGTASGLTSGDTPVTLFITRPPLDKFTEIYYLLYPSSESLLQISFLIAEGVPGPGFPVATWDTTNGTLLARADFTASNGSTVTLSLTCQNFRLYETKYNFTCTYSSTLRPGNLVMIFKSK
ncbi:MAG: hypothetical protein AABY64_07870 [Bdellovibrionota bacterium]